MKVYLAGAVQHSNYAMEWREDIKSMYDGKYEFVNPLDSFPGDPAGSHDEWSDEELIDRDLGLVRASDAVLLYWDPDVATFGSCVECYKAYDEFDMPVGVWYQSKIGSESPWLRDYTTVISTHSSVVLESVESHV